MADSQNKSEAALGVTARPDYAPITTTEVIAGAASLLWFIVAVIYFVTLPAEEGQGGLHSMRFVMTLLAVFLPIAMIWVAAAAARSARIVREESRRLQAAIDAMRQTYVAERQARGSGMQPMERRPGDTMSAARQPDSALASFSSNREQARKQPLRPQPLRPAEEQPRLALGTQADETGPPLDRSDLIRALNFPETDKDELGFKSLRRALKDRQARQLVQASQDVLTLLSQDGIYMDDLRPDRARPEIWRRFAKGERGRAVAALGGVRDRSSLALTAARMREDTIFRDAAHHFLRLFDKMLVSFEPEASDEELGELSETRTARAFMLFGRVTGAFD